MSLFSKTKPAADRIPQAQPRVDSTVPTEGQVTTDAQILDILTGMLRTYGGRGFDIDGMSAAELRQRCEAWALHLLTGAPAPLGANWPDVDEPGGPVSMNQRRWTDMQQFFRTHRRDEQASVQGRVEGMRGLIGELASGLRNAIADDSAKDELVTRELSALGKAVEGESLAEIRVRLARTVDCVTRVIHERQVRYEEQLQSMSEHVHSLRADLVSLREKASLDALTQVHNRGAFDEVLASQVDFCFMSGQTMALLMLDLDHFKEINDSYGHPAGDLVLQAVANVLVRTFPRRSDFIARYGGEEFVIMLVDIEMDDLAALCERILNAVRALEIEYYDVMIRLTCSIGAAFCTRADDAASLLSRADQMLYQAKNAGRNRVLIAMEEQ